MVNEVVFINLQVNIYMQNEISAFSLDNYIRRWNRSCYSSLYDYFGFVL